ncbi:MAG TPA: cytochrome C [Thermoanaerobaculia bacterium]|nr:cytochrome C [Thermoanaerobaculia bacterium]
MRFKPLLLLGLAAGALLVVLSGRSSAQGAAAGDDDATRIRIGFKVAPVPLNLHDKDPNMVGLGSYIVNTQGWCNDCHTLNPWAAGHDPTSGQEPQQMNAAQYLAGGSQFGTPQGGVVTAANLTPDEHGLPDGLSLALFLKTFQTGLDPDNGHPEISPYLQAMPWPYHRLQTRHDLEAIYEYLRAIPSLQTPSSDAATRREME